MATFTKRSGKWHARVRRKGYPTECKAFDTKREAQDWAGGVEDRMAQNRYVIDKNSRRVTLERVIDEYLERRVPNLKGHQPKYETLDWKKRPLAKRVIGTITVADVIDWIDERLEDQVGLYQYDMFGKVIRDKAGNPKPGKNPRRIKPKTVLNELRRLSAIFSWAKSDLEMHALINPVKLIPEERMPKAKGRERRLKKGELRQILRAAKQDEIAHIGLIIEFAIETACRRAEIAKLKLRNYDPENKVIWVLDTKNDDDRDVGLSERAQEILEQVIEAQGLEAPDAKFFPLEPDEISRAFRRCCRVEEIDGKKVKPIGGRLDFDGLTFHDLRHEGTNLYFEKGLKIQDVAHQTGHRSYQSLKRYTHPKGPAIAAKLAGQGGRATGGD